MGKWVPTANIRIHRDLKPQKEKTQETQRNPVQLYQLPKLLQTCNHPKVKANLRLKAGSKQQQHAVFPKKPITSQNLLQIP